MRLIKFLALSLLLCAAPAWAQEEAAVYKVSDVAVDVSAANAAQARDQAIFQGQRQAFEQLMSRLGAEGKAAKANDDTIAGLVQAFEVQKEHAAGQRYVGTLSFQFKPEAVRQFLGNRGVSYTETRARPVVVLPILRSGGHDTLWEDRTAWRAAWEESAKNAGLVPVIVPAGDLDDIAKINAAEALAGKADGLAALIQKYEAGGAVVALLQANLDQPDGKTEGQIQIQHFDASGKGGEPGHLKVAPIASTKAVPEAVAGAVKQVLHEMEGGWRQVAKAGNATGPASYLPISVPVPTLAAWSQIRSKLGHVALISRTQVVTMTRGLVSAELEFHGDIPALQAAIAEQGLSLGQGATGGWELH